MHNSYETVGIMLIDDHAVVRAGYRRFLEQESGYRVIAETVSGGVRFGRQLEANYHSLLRQKLGISTDIELFRLTANCGVIDSSPRADSDS